VSQNRTVPRTHHRARRAPLHLAAALLLAACGDPVATPTDAGAGMDAGAEDAGTDAGPGDAGADSGTDAGTDAGREDAGPPPWVGPGCDPERGVECDGDWTGRCDPACEASECCSPQNGAFVCAPRGEDGSCPAADLWVDPEPIDGRYRLSWRYFAPDACVIEEACVGAPGWRRLLRFATWTPNTGDADLYMGPPEDTPDLFEYSACHAHHHFVSYARYELRDLDGAIAARGHKQSFCLVDSYRYPEGDARDLHYTCDDQGIQRGYQDVYADSLDCNWVDVTDVAPGDYTLVIELNYDGVLLERDYDNNRIEVPVTIRPSDVTLECPPSILRGLDRNCGLEREGAFACTPGERIEVACSAICGAGSCTGDPILRVCEAGDDPDCDTGFALASNDNSYCDMELCPLGGDCCPRVELDCPASGEIVVFSGPYDPRSTATCDLVVRPVP